MAYTQLCIISDSVIVLCVCFRVYVFVDVVVLKSGVRAMDFKVNDKFSSLNESELQIANYSKKKHVVLHKREARTLEAALRQKKLSLDRIKNKDL